MTTSDNRRALVLFGDLDLSDDQHGSDLLANDDDGRAGTTTAEQAQVLNYETSGVQIQRLDLRPVTAMARASLQHIDRFIQATRHGDALNAERVLDQAQALQRSKPESQPVILKALCAAVQAGAVAEVITSSIAAKIRDLTVEQCLSVQEELNSDAKGRDLLLAVANHSLLRLPNSTSTSSQHAPSLIYKKPTPLATRILALTEPYNNNPLQFADQPVISPPDLGDDSFMTVIPVGIAIPCARGKEMARSISKCAHFLRAEAWKMSNSFMFLFISKDTRPLNMLDLFNRFLQERPQNWPWADRVTRYGGAILSKLGFERKGATWAVTNNSCYFVLLSWDLSLHRKIEETAFSCLKVFLPRAVKPRQVSHVKIPGISPEEIATLSLFTEEVRQAITILADMPDRSILSASRSHIHRQWMRFASDERISPTSTSMAEQLRVMGFDDSSPRAQGLFCSAALWEREGSPGTTALSLAMSFLDRVIFSEKILQFPRMQMLGDSILNRTGSVDEQVGGRTVSVHTCDGSSLIKRFQEGTCLIEQLHSSRWRVPAVSNPDRLLLFHGTTISAATNILTNGIDESFFTVNSNFGKAFYTTPEQSYAFFSAYSSFMSQNNPSRDNDPAVIIFSLSSNMLHGHTQLLDLSNDIQRWGTLVGHCRRSSLAKLKRNNPTFSNTYDAAMCIMGPIAANATDIEIHSSSPTPLTISGRNFMQYAFRDPGTNDDGLEFLPSQSQITVIRIPLNRGQWGPQSY